MISGVGFFPRYFKRDQTLLSLAFAFLNSDSPNSSSSSSCLGALLSPLQTLISSFKL